MTHFQDEFKSNWCMFLNKGAIFGNELWASAKGMGAAAKGIGRWEMDNPKQWGIGQWVGAETVLGNLQSIGSKLYQWGKISG